MQACGAGWHWLFGGQGDVLRRFVVAQAQKNGLAKLVAGCHFFIGDLSDESRRKPGDVTLARGIDHGGFVANQRLKFPMEPGEPLTGEAGANFADIDQTAMIVRRE